MTTVYPLYSGPDGAVTISGVQNVTVSATYSVQPNDYIVTATGAGSFVITLLPAAPYKTKNVIIKCLTTASITVNAASGEFIDSSSSRTLSNGEVLDIISDGVKWVDTVGSTISGAKLVDGTVTASKLSTDSVTADKIATGAVGNSELATDSVTADKIATGAVSTSEINTAATPTVNTIYTNNWFRSNGNTGWYNQTHGGGIWMEDSNYVKVYGNKAFMPSSGGGTNGIIFPLDPGGGGGDSAFIKYYVPLSGEDTVLHIGVTNDASDYIKLSTPTGTVSISSRLTLSGCGARGATGYAITTSNDSIGSATRYSGYIEWQSDVGLIGTNYFLSDIRKKDNVKKSTTNASELIKNIDFVQFDWKPESGNEGHVDIGVSAQQIKKLNPSLVKEMSDGTLMIHDPTLIPYFGKAIQEQQQIIEAQQQQIQSLEERIKKLEELISKGT
jgi:hypothetical protein